MSKRKPAAQSEDLRSADVATNRRAGHKFELLDRFECGIQLLGTEVKSLREGKAQLGDAYAVIERGEVWLRNAHIPPYAPASRENHEPERPRKLLLHRHEIERLIGRSQRRGLTLIPPGSTSRGRWPRWSWPLLAARSSVTGVARSAIAISSGRWSASIVGAFAERGRERRGAGTGIHA